MPRRIFMEMIRRKLGEKKLVCVGLDSDSAESPKGVEHFNCEIVDATHDLVCAYKPNIAFYEGLGIFGMAVLKATVDYIRFVAKDVPVIGDMKRGDIGSTNLQYVKAAFEYLGFDAITVHHYPGKKAMQPFLDMKDKGIFVVCRTSDEGSDEFQTPNVVVGDRCLPTYQYVAHRVAANWNQNGNCGLVVGATHPEELAQVRAIVGDDMPILIPAVGAQGGNLEASVRAGRKNIIISASRSIIFASLGPDFAQAARLATMKLHKEVQLLCGL